MKTFVYGHQFNFDAKFPVFIADTHDYELEEVLIDMGILIDYNDPKNCTSPDTYPHGSSYLDFEEEEDDWDVTPPRENAKPEEVREFGEQWWKEISEDERIKLHPCLWENILKTEHFKHDYKEFMENTKDLSEEEKKNCVIGHFAGPLYHKWKEEGEIGIFCHYDCCSDIFPVLRGDGGKNFRFGGVGVDWFTCAADDPEVIWENDNMLLDEFIDEYVGQKMEDYYPDPRSCW